MLVPKKNRLAIYSYLFREGVLVAKKDFGLAKHGDIEVPNLHVIKLMLSLQSRGYVKDNFSWQYHYYVLTNEGMAYLREYLHITNENAVPATLKKTTKSQPPKFRTDDEGEGRGGRGGRGRGRGGRGRGRGGFGDRDDYRGPRDGDNPRTFNPDFESRREGGGGFRGGGFRGGGFRGGGFRGGQGGRGRGREEEGTDPEANQPAAKRRNTRVSTAAKTAQQGRGGARRARRRSRGPDDEDSDDRHDEDLEYLPPASKNKRRKV